MAKAVTLQVETMSIPTYPIMEPKICLCLMKIACIKAPKAILIL